MNGLTIGIWKITIQRLHRKIPPDRTQELIELLGAARLGSEKIKQQHTTDWGSIRPISRIPLQNVLLPLQQSSGSGVRVTTATKMISYIHE